jgi:hypothetical protein
VEFTVAVFPFVVTLVLVLLYEFNPFVFPLPPPFTKLEMTDAPPPGAPPVEDGPPKPPVRPEILDAPEVAPNYYERI